MTLTGFEIPRPAEIPEGAFGVWQVPEIGTSTPLYTSPSALWQQTVDDENSALIYPYGRGRMIADHADSKVPGGIWNVNQMKVGGSAFLIEPTKTTQYRCIAIWKARRYPTYYSFQSVSIWPKSSLDIFCASCADEEGKEVYVAYFEYVGEMP